VLPLGSLVQVLQVLVAVLALRKFLTHPVSSVTAERFCQHAIRQ